VSLLELAYAEGQLSALRMEKLAWPAPTSPTVQSSNLLTGKKTKLPDAVPAPPATPATVSQTWNQQEQAKTRLEPKRKLSAELCTSCRKAKHYGSCSAPRAIPEKVADFNSGMSGDSSRTSIDAPATSPHYHSATSADTSLARARDTQPADVQAGTAFADLFRHLGITSQTDEPGRQYGGLWKVSGIPAGLEAAADSAVTRLSNNSRMLSQFAPNKVSIPAHSAWSMRNNKLHEAVQPLLDRISAHAQGQALSRYIANPALNTSSRSMEDMLQLAIDARQRARGKLGGWQLWGTGGHSMWEDRGPGSTPNPYEERLTIKSPPVGWADEGEQRVKRTFDQIDGAVDTANIENTVPDSGPAVGL
jgi:hypothetical protein